ncbi:MAG: hypothetical protein JNK85_22640 [Verrucomicrobiales bacterium]|nr:hypothetical protein [Verrucomicrobiales bacterium]
MQICEIHLLKRYLADPAAADLDVRRTMKIAAEDYYTVSVWPNAGRVDIDRPGSRAVPKRKVSKSTQS